MPLDARIVGIAEMAVSDRAEDVLVTHSLGSCIGVTLYHPGVGVGGLLHAMLPLSSLDPGKAAAVPQMFTDTGVSALLQALFDLGATRRGMVAVAAGAASQLDDRDLFRIGQRNHTVLRKLLWRNGILLAAEDVGGSASRTMYLEMATGLTLVKVNGEIRALETMAEG